MRTFVRWIVPVLLAANGLMMIAAPVPWYGAVPGVTETGAYNPHFIRDIGFAYLASAAGFAWWAARRPGATAAMIPAAIFLGGHMVFHFAEAVFGHHPGSDIVRDFVGVYIPGLLAIWIVWRGLANKEA